jgi:hypothetical protein
MRGSVGEAERGSSAVAMCDAVWVRDWESDAERLIETKRGIFVLCFILEFDCAGRSLPRLDCPFLVPNQVYSPCLAPPVFLPCLRR